MHNVLERLVNPDEERYITLDLTNDLATGQTITAATWTPDSAICEYVAASSAVDAGGKMVSAKFRHLDEGDATVSVLVTTTNPTEQITQWLLFKQVAVPLTA